MYPAFTSYSTAKAIMNQTSESSLYTATDPYALFHAWFADAKNCADIKEPTAMTLATATKDGLPSARIVLLKDVTDAGFTFYSNQQSRKGAEMAGNPHAALCFYWMPLDTQVRIEGTVTPVDAKTADAYFASRGREKQLGAWASMQSQPMASRGDLQARIAQMDETYKNTDVPRPPHWSGWLLEPTRIEFWLQRDHRLHERVCFTRASTNAAWVHQILYP